MIDELWHKRHDYFNLFMLPIVIVFNLAYLLRDGSTLNMMLQFWVFLMYIVIDTIWLIVVPNSVASPGTIISHHIVSICGWSLPMLTNAPDLMRCVSPGLLVEINTWFLIARRQTKQDTTLAKIYGMIFYITWVCFRLTMYPWILNNFTWEFLYKQGFEHSKKAVVIWVLWILMIGLNALNMFWTGQMLYKMMYAPAAAKGAMNKGL